MIGGMNFIDGRWTRGRGAPFESRDPACGAVIWKGACADDEQIAAAVEAARAAFPAWARRSIAQRCEILDAYAALLEAERDALAELIARETGKPLWDALGEARAMHAKIAISRRAWKERTGERQARQDGILQRVTHRPHGVMAVFGPYNFPGHLPNGHIVPALIAGNTVVFKPSELTPAVAQFVVHLLERAGIPRGVVNLIHGGGDVGAALLDRDVNGVLFTGSRRTGLGIHRHFAGRPEVILALEMGGNNPLIVWDVADAHAAALIAAQSAYVTSGQRCTCARRLILPAGEQGDRVVEALLRIIDGIRVDAWDARPEPFMGPLVSAKTAERVAAAAHGLEKAGGIAIRPLRRLPDRGDAFVSPALYDLTRVPGRPDEEIFGPVLAVIRAGDFDEAIAIANDTIYGLAAGLVSDDAALHRRFCEMIEAGIVNWNRPLTGASSAAPFGGVKQSGNHRPSAYYAADYCAWPVASLDAAQGRALVEPESLPPGLPVDRV